MNSSSKETTRLTIINNIKLNLKKLFKLINYKFVTGDFLLKLYK